MGFSPTQARTPQVPYLTGVPGVGRGGEAPGRGTDALRRLKALPQEEEDAIDNIANLLEDSMMNSSAAAVQPDDVNIIV